MKTLEEYKEDYFLFLEAGFIAINQADEDSVLKLFNATKLLDSKNPLTEVGMGYLHLHKLELEKSIKCFENILKKDPKNEMAKTFLGIALSWSPTRGLKGESLLVETKKSNDKQIKNLSSSALNFVDKFIKKEPGPAEIRKK